jgi:hypothetical protein
MAVKEITYIRDWHVEVTHDYVRLARRPELDEGVCEESLCLLMILWPVQ